MAFNRIEEVQIDGSMIFAGAYCYSFSLDVGLAGEPSKINISLVNESGDFLEPVLSADVPVKITVGTIFEENYYLIRREINKDTGQRLMDLTFVDGSIILDRINVQLNGISGDKDTTIPGLLLVGSPVHPCDVNEDGVFDNADLEEIRMGELDPCELRCPTSTGIDEPLINQCFDREITELQEIKYTFGDLLNALQGKVSDLPRRGAMAYPIPNEDFTAGSVSILPPQPERNKNVDPFNRLKIGKVPANLPTVLMSFTGTLREVLNQWCALVGWSYYWENDSLNFIDTVRRPKVNFAMFDSLGLESTNDVRTLEGTIARGFVSSYRVPGTVASNNCEQSQPLLLQCLTLADLFGETYKPSWKASAVVQGDIDVSQGNPLDPPIPDPTDSNVDSQIEYLDDIFPDGVDIAAFEKSCVLAYYSDTLRHLYNLWTYYGITSPQRALLYKATIGPGNSKWLDRLGQMNILNVFHAGSEGVDLDKYKKLLTGTWASEEVDSQGNKRIVGKPIPLLTEEEAQEIQSNNGYFVVVQRSKYSTEGDRQEDLIDKQFRIEENLATAFMGQNWYRAYVAPDYGDQPKISNEGKYLAALATNINDIPFTQFNHTYNSTVGKMIGSFVQRQRNISRQYSRLKFTQRYAKNISSRLVRSILYRSKETSSVWSPSKNENTELKALSEELGKKMFRRIPINSLQKNEKRALVSNSNAVPQVEEDRYDYIELYVFYPVDAQGGEMPMSYRFIENPNEENPEYNDSGEPFGLASRGLQNKNCVAYKIKGIEMLTPAGASVLFSEQHEFRWKNRMPDIIEFDVPSFKVYVTNSAPNRGIVPKTEIALIEPAPVQNTMETDYYTMSISRDSVRFLNQLTTECELPPERIAEIHAILSKNLNFSISDEFRTRQYSVYGVELPQKISIKDGLQELSVTIGNDGVRTNITIGDSLFTPPSQDYLLKLLENGDLQRLANYRTNSI